MPLLRINADFINRGEDLCKRVFVSSWFFFVLEILRTRLLTVSCVRRVVLRGEGFEGNIQRKFVDGWRL